MSQVSIKFKNFTDRDFTWSFDSIPYTFKAGETIYLEDFKAKHFAKHLVDRELNLTKPSPTPTNNLTARKSLEAQCFPSDEVVTPSEALNINEKIKAENKLKEVKKEEKVEEKEFADLEDEVGLKDESKETKSKIIKKTNKK